MNRLEAEEYLRAHPRQLVITTNGFVYGYDRYWKRFTKGVWCSSELPPGEYAPKPAGILDTMYAALRAIACSSK